MSSPVEFAYMANASALPWAEIPEMPVADLVTQTAARLARGARLCAWFAVPETNSTSLPDQAPFRKGNTASLRLVSLLAIDTENTLVIARSLPFSGEYPALTPLSNQAHLFERELWEQYGITPLGHPWLKPVRRTDGRAPANAPFFRVEGSEVHEVAVGPVHAGIIEPGHFRFQCAGEEVMHLEIALGYQHRGIERALLGGPHRVSIHQMETIAGDSSIAHATAHATLLESLAGTEASLRGQWLRAIALELERLANHTGDLGALAGDVAFLPTQAACGKIRGDFLNLTALLCGNRFGRGLVRPGGARHDLDAALASQLSTRLDASLADARAADAWLWDAASVRARFECVGQIFTPQAADIGLVGPAARASGLVRDVRYDHPAGWHRFAQIPISIWPDGDVAARAHVRSLEIQRSGAFLRDQLAAPPDGPASDPTPLAPPAPDTLAIALVEGWRGEVCHVALTDDDGRFRHYKIIDPSFHNWTGLALALRGTAISDFPICNKSFNLSYCGFDL